MFKKFAAIAMGGGCLLAMALCLGLLPVTALAAGGAPTALYVGNQVLKNSPSYWTTDPATGELTEYTEGGDAWNVQYDPESVTLTLKNATVVGKAYGDNNGGIGIYATSSSGPLSLNIVLDGNSKVSGMYGINVVSSGDALLNISGSGSLTVSGLAYNGIGIFLNAQNGDAALTIDGSSVTASGDQLGGSGVQLLTGQTGSPNLTIEVKGGSLQASGETNGIHFLSNENDATVAANLQVSGNAMVKTSSIRTTKDGTGQAPELTIGASTSGTGGIVWNGSEGTAYGDVTLDKPLTIDQGETLTIPEGSSLTSNDKLANNGTVTIENGGTLTDADKVTNAGTINVESGGTLNGTPAGGTVVYAPVITANPTSQTVTEGEAAEFSVAATGENSSYQWQQNADGDGWVDIPGATGASYTTEATTTSMSDYQYRCVVSNSAGSVTSSAATLTVNEHVHEWVVAWSWDGTKATATFTCEGDTTHQETPEVEVTSAVKTPATCTEAGVTAYTATVEFGGKTYTSTKNVADVPAAGHKLIETEAKAPTCTEPGSAEYWTCGVCGKVFSDAAGEREITPEDAVIPAAGHEFEGGLCSVCGARDTSFSPALVSGDGAKWTKGSSKGLTFVSSAAFADLVEVRLDGRVLSASEYVVREGSTVVTLPAKLLEGLKAGDHELLIVSGSGTVRASLTVAEAAKVEEAPKAEKASADELPASGDSSAPALAIAAATAAGAGLVVLSRRRAAR